MPGHREVHELGSGWLLVVYTDPDEDTQAYALGRTGTTVELPLSEEPGASTGYFGLVFQADAIASGVQAWVDADLRARHGPRPEPYEPRHRPQPPPAAAPRPTPSEPNTPP